MAQVVIFQPIPPALSCLLAIVFLSLPRLSSSYQQYFGTTELSGFRITPLLLAVDNNLPDCVLALIENGADVNICDSNGQTPLHHTVRYKDLQIAQILLNHGASIEIKDSNGETPYDLGNRLGYEEFANFILFFSSQKAPPK